MRASPCIDLQLPDEERVELLMEEYDFFVKDSDHFCQRLEALTELRGKAVVGEWIEKVRAGRTQEVVLELLKVHYDPTYAASIARNFQRFGDAEPLTLESGSADAMQRAAHQLAQR
jgi:tRNA 2-selenouridine synthase